MFDTFLFRGIVKVLASLTKKENRLRPIFCPKDLLTRFGNRIPTLSHIVIGGTGIMLVKQIKVCIIYSVDMVLPPDNMCVWNLEVFMKFGLLYLRLCATYATYDFQHFMPLYLEASVICHNFTILFCMVAEQSLTSIIHKLSNLVYSFLVSK